MAQRVAEKILKFYIYRNLLPPTLLLAMFTERQTNACLQCTQLRLVRLSPFYFCGHIVISEIIHVGPSVTYLLYLHALICQLNSYFLFLPIPAILSCLYDQ